MFESICILILNQKIETRNQRPETRNQKPSLRIGVCWLVGGMLALWLMGCRREPKEPPLPVGSIVGTVYLEDGSPCHGATVFVDGLNRFTVTNHQGRYLLTLVPQGLYTIGAVKLGYKKAVRTDVTVLAKRTTSGIDFTLIVDETYVPDTIHILKPEPLEGTRLDAGKEARVGGLVQYTLSNASWGKVVVTIVDEKGKGLIVAPAEVTARKGTHTFPFTLRFITPTRLAGEVRAVAYLVLGGTDQPISFDEVKYYVGIARDEVAFESAKPAFGGALPRGENLTLEAQVRFRLESLPQALLRVEALASQARGGYTVILTKQELEVEQTADQPATETMTLEFSVPKECTALKLKATLLNPKNQKSLAAAWSPLYLAK